MTQVDILRNKLIDCIFGIKDEDVLKAIDTILSQTEKNDDVYTLSEHQIAELEKVRNKLKGDKQFLMTKLWRKQVNG